MDLNDRDAFIIDDDNRLTREMILGCGFKEVQFHTHPRIMYERKPNNSYPFNLRITIGDYPTTNPNVGVFYIHTPKHNVSFIPKHLLKKEIWTDEDHDEADKCEKTVGEELQAIAWFVHTFGRFRDLYESISGEKLLP